MPSILSCNTCCIRGLLRTNLFEYGRRDTADTRVAADGSDPDVNTKYVFTAINAGTTSSGFVNGSSIFSAVDTNLNTQSLNQIDIGANNGDSASKQNPFDGKIQEIIIYETDQTNNRGAYEGNIADHYSITGVPTGANTVNGFVETWYDQSGNGNDAPQTTASQHPKIVNNGSLVSNGIDFDGSNDTLDMPTDLISSTNSASAFVVAKSDTTGGSGAAVVLSRNSPDFRFYVPIIVSSNFNFGYQDSATKISLGAADTNKHLFTAIAGSSNAEAFLDSTSKGTVSSADGKSALTSGGIASINDIFSLWNGQIEEILVYASDQSANRAALETNIAAKYGITLS